MIHEIAPHRLDINYREIKAQSGSRLLVFDDEGRLYCRLEPLCFPTLAELEPLIEESWFALVVDEEELFLARLRPGAAPALPGYDFQEFLRFSRAKPQELAFAAVTGAHLANWYATTRFCTRCGHPLTRSVGERSLGCEHCGWLTYPRINPCIIVAITDGDRLLMSRTILRPFFYGLTAGFMEIGETFEDTVHREAMEEAGLLVKNLKFFAAQPWAPSASLLMGYFAEVDGSTEISIDPDEIIEARWFSADEIEYSTEDYSLTGEMINHFKRTHSSQTR